MRRAHVGWRMFAITVSVSTIAAVLTIGAASAASTHPARTVGTSTHVKVERVGAVNLRALSAASRRGVERPYDAPNREFGNWATEAEKPSVPNGLGVGPPSPPTTPVVSNHDHTGWDGINHSDNRLANNGNQFSLEPPDQGLCAGWHSPNGPGWGPEVVESVNDALMVFDGKGERFTNPVSLSEFYDLPPTIDRGRGNIFGPFESDPKCYFDPDTQRWFHTLLVISQDPATGAFQTPTYIYMAVSTSEEALGGYIIYRVDATNIGHPNCPCFGDQPLLGADKYGFYVSTAEYDLDPFGGNFNGPQLYAFSKAGLESGDASGVLITGITHTVSDRTTGTLQPAMSPNGVYEAGRHGTEYFLSGYDCVASAACAIAEGQFNLITVWALTNTASLDTTPALSLSLKDITTKVYGSPVEMSQRSGPLPLGNLAGHSEPGVINANDSRMNQVVFAKGMLWSGINTVLAPGDHDGIQWFQVEPSVSAGGVDGTIHGQGYIAVDGHNNVAFPSIGVTKQGRAAVAFTLVGPNYSPSAAHMRLDPSGPAGPVEIVSSGFRPEDGFTCYPEIAGSDVCRWGDYSAAVATPSGAIYLATEYIANGPRTFNANWATFVWQIRP